MDKKKNKNLSGVYKNKQFYDFFFLFFLLLINDKKFVSINIGENISNSLYFLINQLNLKKRCFVVTHQSLKLMDFILVLIMSRVGSFWFC